MSTLFTDVKESERVTTAPAQTRRERLRAATVEEIKAAARRRLAADGPQGMTLRAIARDLGMTAPALYRYFPSLGELVLDLIADLYDELTASIAAARDRVPDNAVVDRLLAASRAFRRWAIAHPGEFGLVFGTPLPDLAQVDHETHECHLAGMRFGAVFAELFVALWQRHPFPVPDHLDPALVPQLRDSAKFGELPLEQAYVFLTCWTRLYGLVTMEVFGHFHWCLDDVEPFFEAQLAELLSQLGESAPMRT